MSETTEPYESIFLQWGHHADWESLTWCQDKIDDDDVEYVRKDLYDNLRVKYDAAMKEMLDKNSAAAAALDLLWKELLPDTYGEWDYPMQVYRFIQEDVMALRAELVLLKPLWDSVSSCWKWRAWNVNGGGTYFIDEPEIKVVNGITIGWVSKTGSSHVYINDWQKTLERRPEDV